MGWHFPDWAGNLPAIPAGPIADIACCRQHCAAIKGDGTVALLQSSGTPLPPPANLGGVVSLGCRLGAFYAVLSDGSVTGWGTDPQGKNFASVKNLYIDYGFTMRKIAVGATHAVFVRTDHAIQTQMIVNYDATKPETDPKNFLAPSQIGNYKGAQVAAGDRGGGAVFHDGTFAVWGPIAKDYPPPKLTTEVQKIIFSDSYSNNVAFENHGYVLLLTTGVLKPVGQYMPQVGSDKTDYFPTKTNLTDFGGRGGVYIAAHSAGCGGVTQFGCCMGAGGTPLKEPYSGDVLQYCSAAGTVVTSTCNAGTCGWQNSSGPVGTGKFACGNTPDQFASAPVKTCCIPKCKANSSDCGPDGCGGNCGTCGAGKSCSTTSDASGVIPGSGKCKCIANCDDGNVCTTDDCNATTCVYTANTLACDDGNKCTTGDKCAASKCLAGGPTNCDDGTACTADTCAAATGCANKAVTCDDANTCTTDSCDKVKSCVFTNNTLGCSDNSACTVTDVCSAGKCVAGAALVCDDKNPCTNDTCNATSGCVFTNNTVGCSDGDACTVNDACVAGKCVSGPAPSCDDKNVCTADSCSKATGCVQTATAGACNDGNACTANDACQGGKCAPGTLVTCNDNNVCTDDSCASASGCVYAPNTKNACDDGNSCNAGDHCNATGKCVPTSGLNCDDNNPCTDDPCNATGGCEHKAVADGTACAGANACITVGKCQSGKCAGNVPVDCDDGNPCTADACDTKTGCKYANLAAACDDGDPCTSGDVCQNGACKAGPGCDANAVCTLQGWSGVCVCKSGFVGNGKSCAVCKPDCSGKSCGPDGCGGQCGVCGGNQTCTTKGLCVCAPQCAGKTCGPDGCGGQCGACGKGQACDGSGQCAKICVPQCGGKACGPDGCGGQCGSCGADQFCHVDSAQCRWNACPGAQMQGCCSGNSLVSCSKAGLSVTHCDETSTWCAWDAGKSTYACMATNTGVEPAGKVPQMCVAVPPCKPACDGKAC
ncbi:MAG: hypothetical protein FJ100_20465, partial [Deltaproteobacteria bacterium]|nr:hypothetical protein [Deltaproteobacteria bacterium]